MEEVKAISVALIVMFCVVSTGCFWFTYTLSWGQYHCTTYDSKRDICAIFTNRQWDKSKAETVIELKQ